MSLAQQIKQQQAQQLIKLVEWFGTQSMMAHKLGVSRQTVNNWLKRGRISATMAIKAEEITKGAFNKQSLRPDVIAWIKE